MDFLHTIVDSSRIATCSVSLFLILYGSFRSIKLEEETAFLNEKNNDSLQTNSAEAAGIQIMDSTQALLLPLGASFSLITMFLFFDSLQLLFSIGIASVAMISLAFMLHPMCQFIVNTFAQNNKVSLGSFGRRTHSEILSFSLSACLVFLWLFTGHWLLMDALSMGLCVALITYVRLPSLKVSTFLLTGLLIYDVFWVFFSSVLFNSNVMVKVATRPVDNPIVLMARKLHVGNIIDRAPKLSLPGKLIFPNSAHENGHFSMLGLGDIVMPGLLLCFVLRYESYRNRNLPRCTKSIYHLSYFFCALIGYLAGLLVATLCSEVFKAAQPALLYIVPFMLIPLLFLAYFKGDLYQMWSEPFDSVCDDCIKNGDFIA